VLGEEDLGQGGGARQVAGELAGAHGAAQRLLRRGDVVGELVALRGALVVAFELGCLTVGEGAGRRGDVGAGGCRGEPDGGGDGTNETFDGLAAHWMVSRSSDRYL